METNTQTPPRGTVFLAALRTALAHPGAVLMYAAGLVLLALAPALQTQRTVADLLGQRYPAGETVHHMDANFRTDHGEALAQLSDQLATLGGPLGLLALLWGVFAAGGWLGLLLDPTDRPAMRRFLSGGLRHFPRFLGLAVLVLVLLSAWQWLCFGWPFESWVLKGWFELPRADTALFASEATALWTTWVQGAVHWLGLGLVLSWALFARARFAVQRSRSLTGSALAAAWMLLRHPIRCLRPLALLFAVELVLVSLALGAMARALNLSLLDHPDEWRVWLLALVSLLGLWVSAVVFGARYAAAVEVVRALVKPLPRPDPWQDRIGPPGGPQYPLGDQDEFTVSM